MRIDLRELRQGNGFQFIGGPTVFKVIDRFTFGSTTSPTADSMPIMSREEVWTECYMDDIPLWSPST